MRAAAQEVPAAGRCFARTDAGRDGCGRSDAPLFTRREECPQPQGRRWCKLRTKPHGDRGHPLPGCGRAVPLEPGPQRSDRTLRHSLRDNTFLRGGDARSCCGLMASGAATLAFLTARALEDRRKEEQEGGRRRKRRWREGEEDAPPFFWPGLEVSTRSGAVRLHRVR